MKKLTVKHYVLLFTFFFVTHFAFSQCPPPALTSTSDTICSSDSSQVCVVGNYTAYLWNNGETSSCITAKAAGGYWATVTDANNCTVQSNTFHLNVWPVPSISVIVQGDTLTSFGTLAYQWYYDDNLIPGATSAVYIATQSGYYGVEITDYNGCKYRSTQILINADLEVRLDSGSNVCSGSTIILDPWVTNGIPPYTYAWGTTGSPLSCYNCEHPFTTINASSTYTITVTDASRQTATASVNYTVSGTDTAQQFTVTSTPITCTDTLSIATITINGPSQQYSVKWLWGTVQTFTGVSSTYVYFQPGDYVISLSNPSGCVNSIVHTVVNNGINVSFTNATYPQCSGQATGAVTAVPTGGTQPYRYSWSNGEFLPGISNLLPGAYTVTVVDARGCIGRSTAGIYDLSWNFHFLLNTTDANCSNNGSIISQVAGGTAPYTYNWSNGETTPAISNLGGGAYDLVVTDSAGCTYTGGVNLHSGCYGVIAGRVYADLNNNCLPDTNELAAFAGKHVIAEENNIRYYGRIDQNGYYEVKVQDTGTYSITIKDSWWGCVGQIICGNDTVTINANGDTVSKDIGVLHVQGFDLALSASWTSANPGFPKTYSIWPRLNDMGGFSGTATVTFAYDPNLIFDSASAPLPVLDTVAHTLTWTLTETQLKSFTYLYCWFTVPLSVGLNQMLNSSFSISPTAGDCDITNNTFSFSQVTTGSYDPNEKQVSPANYIAEEDSILTYTIHFQNTGTDSTWFIVLVDTLQPTLDAGSVRNIASSHPFTEFSISGKGILTWVFKPLRLVDSITNPEGSKGFVMFTVKKKQGLPTGTIISNKASIYFDYNEPIVTNTATISVGTGIPVIATEVKSALTVFPNPTATQLTLATQGFTPQWISLYDVSGKKVSEQRFTQQIDISSLTNSMYFIEVRDANTLARTRFIKM